VLVCKQVQACDSCQYQRCAFTIVAAGRGCCAVLTTAGPSCIIFKTGIMFAVPSFLPLVSAVLSCVRCRRHTL
jgi:hypothetical protein